MARMFSFFWALINVVFVTQSHGAQTVNLWHKNYERLETRALVQLALQKAATEYGDFTLSPVTIGSQAQTMLALQKSGPVDIAVAATDKAWENTLLPVYIPIDKGLLGFRVCVIKPTQKTLFNDMTSATELKSHGIKVGVVESWPDRFVYEHYGLKTVVTKSLSMLYTKLYASDIDCISRSVFEVDSELARHSEFVVEENLAFVYPSADII